ncbi:hypothetical protein MTO96_023495 [Rhipicephalus appendiculatus]
MTGLTRNFRGSRSNAESAGDSSSTCGEAGAPRFTFISENIVRLNRFLALLTLHLGTPEGRQLSRKGSTRRSCCERHRESCKKAAKDSVT